MEARIPYSTGEWKGGEAREERKKEEEGSMSPDRALFLRRKELAGVILLGISGRRPGARTFRVIASCSYRPDRLAPFPTPQIRAGDRGSCVSTPLPSLPSPLHPARVERGGTKEGCVRRNTTAKTTAQRRTGTSTLHVHLHPRVLDAGTPGTD